MKNTLKNYLTFSFLFIASISQANPLTETPKVQAGDGLQDGRFGRAIAIEGNLAVIGRSPSGNEAGSAYVFAFTAGQWTEIQKLVPSNGFINDSCGQSVAISGSRIVVGCPTRNLGSTFDVGAVYVFDIDNMQWTETQVIIGPSSFRGGGGGQSGEDFGEAISLDGDRLAIGAPNSGSNNQPGSVYIYEWDGQSWSQADVLMANDATNRNFLGSSVALFGDRVISGAFRDEQAGPNAGAAYVFEFDGMSWQQVQKLIPASNMTRTFGAAVALTSDLLVVTATNDDTAATGAGGAYVFTQDAMDQWVQSQGLYASDAQAFDNLGRQLSVVDGNILIGKSLSNLDPRPGSAYLFKNYANGWIEAKVIQPSEDVVGELYANAVAVSDGFILVSATLDDDPMTADTGSVFGFINDLIFNAGFE